MICEYLTHPCKDSDSCMPFILEQFSQYLLKIIHTMNLHCCVPTMKTQVIQYQDICLFVSPPTQSRCKLYSGMINKRLIRDSWTKHQWWITLAGVHLQQLLINARSLYVLWIYLVQVKTACVKLQKKNFKTYSLRLSVHPHWNMQQHITDSLLHKILSFYVCPCVCMSPRLPPLYRYPHWTLWVLS